METKAITSADQSKADMPRALMWVKDAPLFIDAANLESFYDAVVRPPFKDKAPRIIKISKSMKEELANKFGAKAGLHLPAWLSAIISGGVDISGEISSASSEGETSETSISLEPISTPHRQLEQLTVFYLLEQSSHLLIGNQDSPLAQLSQLSEKS